jgi:hypothetical protein
VDLICGGLAAAWTDFRRAFAASVWAVELDRHYLHTQGAAFIGIATNEEFVIATHALATASSANAFAQHAAPYILNLIRNTIDQPWAQETDFVAFYDTLVECQVRSEWRVPRPPADYGPFAELLLSVADPARFQAALIAYCDFRLLRAFQIRDTQAMRPRKPSDSIFIFEMQWLAIAPFELLALRKIYFACTGTRLALVADHPLLRTVVANPPSLWPLDDTGIARSIRELGERVFANRWRPFTALKS